MSNQNIMSAEEAVKLIQSGNKVFIHTAAATPLQLVNAMTARHEELEDIEIVAIHTEGYAPYTEEKYKDTFSIKGYFIGSNLRKSIQAGRASYVPMFLSEMPNAVRKGIIPVDVAMIQVSTPDQHGYCSIGVSVDVSLSAVQTAKVILAQVNPNMPRTHGDGIIHISKLDAMVEVEDPIYEMPVHEPTELELKIGHNIASLVEDGATLQLGIGGIPNAALKALANHKNLGIHTEMFSDGIIDLIESGVINGSEKTLYKDKVITGFCIGSRRLYDYIDDNPLFEFCDSGFVNDTKYIRQNPKVTAINSAIEIDLFGQVCADSIGTRQYSGVGGQMDFIRGASLSEGGKPIIALPSRTRRGEARIVPILKEGASVVTTRAHVHYIVTEYGIAYLYGKSLKERALELIKIAHPDDREMLEKFAFTMYKYD